MMKVPELHYYDLYAPLVASVDLTYSAEEAEKHVLEALAPLGPEYAAAAKRAFTRALDRSLSRTTASAPARTRTAAPTTCIPTCC